MDGNTLRALAVMAKEGGNYFRHLSVEANRTKRIKEARAEAERVRREGWAHDAEVRAEQRKIRQADAETAFDRQKELIGLRQESQLDTHTQKLQATKDFNDANPTHKGLRKGVNEAGEDVWYREDSRGQLEETDVGVSYAGDPVMAQYKQIDSMRKEVNAEVNKSGYHDLKQSMGKMVDAYRRGNHMSDTAMVFYFLKTLDPQSVARESEVASVEGARAWFTENPKTAAMIPAPLQQAIQSFHGEGKLLPEQRKQILDLTLAAYNNKMDSMDSLKSSYGNIADGRKWNQSDIGLDRIDTSRVTLESLKPDGQLMQDIGATGAGVDSQQSGMLTKEQLAEIYGV